MDYKKRCEVLEEELCQILECSYDGIHVIDGDGITTYYNSACERIEKINKDAVIGKPVSELVEKGIYPYSVALEAIGKKEAITQIQKIHGKDVLVTSTPQIRNGKVVRVVTNSRDITKLNELKQKIENVCYDNKRYLTEIEQLRLSSMKDNGIIYRSKKMQDIILLALKAANVDSTILIEGETGVGKGVLSKFIHNNSQRSKEPFITIDCGAIPENLLESELFGYEPGSFTGANRKGKLGLLEVANGGTVFLDEIAELPLKLQVKLLRAIQEREIYHIGGERPIAINVRFICATHRKLEDMISEGKFRQDFFYRLNVISITIPPLRERPEDIFPLINNIIDDLNEKYNMNKKIEKTTIELMCQYPWPGNVRELENIVERLVVTVDDDLITKVHLPENLRVKQTDKTNKFDKVDSYKDAVNKFETELVEYAIEKCGNVHNAAVFLNIDESTVRRKRKK